MKLVVLTNILTPYRIPLFAEMQRHVDDFTVLLMSEHEENRQWRLERAPFKVTTLPGIHLRPPGAEVSLHVNYGVIRALRRLNPDVVLSGGFTPANIAAAVYCRVFNKRYMGWGEVTRRDATGRSAIRTLLRRFIVRHAAGCVASSSEARDAFVSYGIEAQKVLLAPMPIDVDFFRDRTREAKNSAAVAAMRSGYSSPVLLSVGRLTGIKGYPELFAIYRRILEAKPEATLLIVGDGPQRKEYEQQVAEAGWSRVHFVGFVQAEDLPRYLALADGFIFHTLFDPFGAVSVEAMAAGVPVAASVYAASTHDFVEECVTGVRIDPRDAQGSAAAILRLLDLAENQRAAMLAAAYQRAKRHDIASTALAMLEFMSAPNSANGVASAETGHGR